MEKKINGIEDNQTTQNKEMAKGEDWHDSVFKF